MRWLGVGFLCVGMAILVGGCWNRAEPEGLSLIGAVAFDYDGEADEYVITVQVARPEQMGGASGGEGQGGGAVLPLYAPVSRGRTAYEAMVLLEAGLVRVPFWAHAEAVLIGEELARQGISPVIDFIDRDREFRLSATVVVVEGWAGPVLEQPFAFQGLAAAALPSMVQTAAAALSMVPPGTLHQRHLELARPGRDMLMARLVPREVDEPVIPSPAMVEGGALFREDRMVGWLDGRATRGWHLITGSFQESVLTVEGDEDVGWVSVALLRHQTELSLDWDGDVPRFTVKAEVMGRMQGQTGRTGIGLPSPLLVQLEQRLARELEEDIERCLSIAQDLGSDIFGFGELIYRKHPRRWRELEDGWRDRVFPQLEVSVAVAVQIERPGMILRPEVGR